MSHDENVSASVVESRHIVDDDGINKLTVGLLSLYESDLVKAKGQLDELTKKQMSVITQLQDENEKLNKMQCTNDLQEMCTMVKQYHTKLTTIKKDMSQLHERSLKLKKRAMKLQQIKQKEALQRQHQRELQIQREQELIAKPLAAQKKN
ncbi:biogenesis of lysosome-related organelles complex 1 subunit 6-like isoform X1 [Schistocerca cancellata]|uniref:biogenesis of lysosome-related organelles complex 1 subunit 6-like isoform X1 n=1 Tax=Schistocerca cancellata TaxID=274614 RepID=UPI002118C25E|nr:biogenesis of lysosome-related organelles complex 1 subunit 6-like isoform X1 [Schistocerca cancellata]